MMELIHKTLKPCFHQTLCCTFFPHFHCEVVMSNKITSHRWYPSIVIFFFFFFNITVKHPCICWFVKRDLSPLFLINACCALVLNSLIPRSMLFTVALVCLSVSRVKPPHLLYMCCIYKRYTNASLLIVIEFWTALVTTISQYFLHPLESRVVQVTPVTFPLCVKEQRLQQKCQKS